MNDRSFNQLLETDHIALVRENDRLTKELRCIKSAVDSYYNGTCTYTMGENDFDVHNHRYPISTLIGIIRNHTYAGLGMMLPHDTKQT